MSVNYRAHHFKYIYLAIIITFFGGIKYFGSRNRPRSSQSLVCGRMKIRMPPTFESLRGFHLAVKNIIIR